MNKALILATLAFITACSSNEKKQTQIIDKKTVGLLPTEKQPELKEVAQFKGAQVTGVTASKDGRIFANFPRWRENLPFSVVEIMPDGSHRPYPDETWNSWNGRPENNKFHLRSICFCSWRLSLRTGSQFANDERSCGKSEIISL